MVLNLVGWLYWGNGNGQLAWDWDWEGIMILYLV